MDPEDALLLLETELINAASVDYDQLPNFATALKVVAQTQQGYTGFAWQAGTSLLEAYQYHGISPEVAFDEFGWDTLATAIYQSIVDNQLLHGLSYANSEFHPLNKSESIFNHHKISHAVRHALSLVPHAFIKPSVLGSLEPAIQEEFGRLLEKLPELSINSELMLQWSASILRVVPTHTPTYHIAAVTLLDALYSEKQIFSAYYAFRALAEQYEPLWSSAICEKILQSLIQRCHNIEQNEQYILEQLVSDDDVIRNMTLNINLLFVIGSLAIYLTKMYGDQKVEATAWRFVNELHVHSSLVAHEFEQYLVDDQLPVLPTSNRSQIEEFEQRFKEACADVETELRPRRYKRLANHIYQDNIERVLLPLYEQICAGNFTPALISTIDKIDPEELVKESKLQQISAYKTGTKVDRKMIADFAKVRKGLRTAAQLKVELETIKSQMAEDTDEKESVFWDFHALLGKLTAQAQWALQMLLPDLWDGFVHGVEFVKRESKGQRYGTR